MQTVSIATRFYMRSLVMFPMKTTAKTIFSLMAAGFVLTTINGRSVAQSSETSPEKPLSPQIMKILCERSPLNSRCAQSSNPDSSAGTASGDAPKEDKGEMKGDKKEETTPSTPSESPAPSTVPDPSAPVSAPTSTAPDSSAPASAPMGTTPDPSMPAPATGSPASGGTLPPTGTPSTTTPDPATTAPVESPGTPKPYQSEGDKLSNPVGPSSALPSVPSKISAEPTAPAKPSGSASELASPKKTTAPAVKPSSPDSSKPSSTAAEPASTEKAPAAEVPSSSSPEGVSKPASTEAEPSVPTTAPAAEPTSPGATGGSSSEAPTSGSSVVDVVGSNAKLKTLSAAIKAAGIDETLAGKGPFTIFAPTDEAFAALPPEALKALLKPENKAKLAQLLTYHVVAGKVESKTLKSGDTASVQGQPIAVKVEGSKVMVNDANVTKADVEASNGVIHLIDKVILPSAG
jgi:uncharacterized surface protein with fasciclin (FAS1) repeats